MSQYVHLLRMLPIITFRIALKHVSEHAYMCTYMYVYVCTYVFHLLFNVVIYLIVGET